LELTIKNAQPPSVFCTLAVKLRLLGTVHDVNFQELPATNPSGSIGCGSLTT
jgi:hypothetical protein